MSENVFYELTPVQVLNGYINGIFPMGNDDESITWYEANPRAVLPLDKPLNINRSLKQVLNKNVFEVKINAKFTEVIEECAKRDTTWINDLIVDAYVQLHRMGFAHSVEAYYEGELAGGLYGVAINGAFFGESMFFKKSYASKIAVVKMYDILVKNGFHLLDIQMMTDVFRSFGAEHISKAKYLKELDKALKIKCEFKL
jgi:leucyl/phenylalanyl-tRNA--protein transferase